MWASAGVLQNEYLIFLHMELKLNENLSKISDFLNEGKENYLSQNKHNNQNFNHQKKNRDEHNQKTLVNNKKEKSPINTINNSNHNIDVNA